MRSIAFLTHKGGTGKTTLAASLAVAATDAGERVIALDLDPQASLFRWGKRREATKPKQNLSKANASPMFAQFLRASPALGLHSQFLIRRVPTTQLHAS